MAQRAVLSTELQEDERRSEMVVEAVAAVEGTPPDELSPLYETLEPDALDSLFRRNSVDGWVEFEYCGWHLDVNADGRIVVRERDEAGERTSGWR